MRVFLVTAAVLVAVFVYARFGHEPIPVSSSKVDPDVVVLSPDTRVTLTKLIKGYGYNCPLVKSAYREGEDAYGTVSRVHCGPDNDVGTYGYSFRVTARPNGGWLVAPWE